MPEKIIFHFANALFSSIVCAMTIKKAIQRELKRKNWTRYRLVKELEGKIPARTVYAFFAGEQDLTTEKASIILKVLRLKIKR